MKYSKSKIQIETDCNKFASDMLNRKPKQNSKLRASMDKYGWLDAFPMLVTLGKTHLIIKDGQHRFEIAKELGIPFKYVVSDEADISAAEISVGKAWTLTDHVTCIAAQGNVDYKRLLSFQDQTKLPMTTCVMLLKGSNQVDKDNFRYVLSGGFKLNDWNGACDAYNVIAECGRYVKWNKDRRFIIAISLAVRCAGINLNTLSKRIKSNPGMMEIQPNTLAFVAMIDRIYNYRSPIKDKIDIVHFVKLGLQNGTEKA